MYFQSFNTGCYWGTEKFFRHDFSKSFPSSGKVTDGHVGFMGPETAKANPTYKEVHSTILQSISPVALKIL
jgi:peptide methionine sulfoxide reductase MsrA